jgi:hypothetical protein
MKFLKNIINYSISLTAFVVLIGFLNSCGLYKPVDARKVSPNVENRVKKNLEEGKGFTIMGANKGGNTSFQFASSNPMWRATLDVLDFIPLTNVSYSGGIISTDWYADKNAKNESIKITVRFLSNEIRSDGIKVIVHKKKCITTQDCSIRKITSVLENELRVAILKQAIIFEKESTKKNKKKRPELRN